MKDNSKQAKFFCENCGAQVPEAAKMCMRCGRFFSSIRCPECGLTGSAGQFTNGCPSCGYAAKPTRGAKSLTRAAYKKRAEDSPLPIWIYAVALAALVGIVSSIVVWLV